MEKECSEDCFKICFANFTLPSLSFLTMETSLAISSGMKLQIIPIGWRPKYNGNCYKRLLLRQSFTTNTLHIKFVDVLLNMVTWDSCNRHGFGEAAKNFQGASHMDTVVEANKNGTNLGRGQHKVQLSLEQWPRED